MRIVWLAAADARGHLMRAHLLRGLLGRAGVEVDVITTSEEGRAFLAALGTPAEVLSHHFGVAYDAWQNMARARTEACALEYLLRPSRAAADRRRLDTVC
jgi:UDP:flavonoid glycosyltransferase YjiC (YdhE family)